MLSSLEEVPQFEFVSLASVEVLFPLDVVSELLFSSLDVVSELLSEVDIPTKYFRNHLKKLQKKYNGNMEEELEINAKKPSPKEPVQQH